ncbi:MAG: hypothetical protein ACD_79C00484G0002 [uncultured bacterium]|nr:MAG: hypothetical protein ACD_79C00484G0002 [uncultured bacterium]
MYKLIDSGDFQRLDKVGEYYLIRPAPQAIWKKSLPSSVWDKKDACFERNVSGGGKWHIYNSRLPKSWIIDFSGLKLEIKLTGFGHIGIFPEHLFESKWISEKISNLSFSPEILNLFAYTGFTSLLSAKHGAKVTHLDSAKGVVDWARNNSKLSGLESKPIRWIIDDVTKFVKKEIKRNKVYDAIILDPPSFGRGPDNELWKLEDHLYKLMEDLKKLFSENFQFILISAHTPNITPLSLLNILKDVCPNGVFESGEMTVPFEDKSKLLPCGYYARWESKSEI